MRALITLTLFLWGMLVYPQSPVLGVGVPWGNPKPCNMVATPQADTAAADGEVVYFALSNIPQEETMSAVWLSSFEGRHGVYYAADNSGPARTGYVYLRQGFCFDTIRIFQPQKPH
jgi:hypothetical protein